MPCANHPKIVAGARPPPRHNRSSPRAHATRGGFSCPDRGRGGQSTRRQARPKWPGLEDRVHWGGCRNGEAQSLPPLGTVPAGQPLEDEVDHFGGALCRPRAVATSGDLRAFNLVMRSWKTITPSLTRRSPNKMVWPLCV